MKIEFNSALSSVENIIDTLKNKEGALLPILHKIQKEIGYIPSESIERIAKKLQQSPAEIHGVISFYHQFRTSPAGEYKIQVCRDHPFPDRVVSYCRTNDQIRGE